MVSAANARLAEGYDHVVVIAPIPVGYGSIPGAAEDVAGMCSQAQALLVAPDEQSVAAIGPNIYDPQRRAKAATAGRTQGEQFAGAVGAIW
jgi:NTE family protein